MFPTWILYDKNQKSVCLDIWIRDPFDSIDLKTEKTNGFIPLYDVDHDL